MPRRGKPPLVTNARTCRKCGSDEWYARRKGGYLECAVCTRERLQQKRSDPARRLFDSAKQRSAGEGSTFAITLEDVRAVWPADGRCPALGIPLQAGTKVVHDGSPTLDRLNSVWGYEPGNIAVLSYRANRLKNNGTAEELESIAAWMRSRGLA